MYTKESQPNYRPQGGPASPLQAPASKVPNATLFQLLFACLVAQLYTLSQIEGFLLADSVEYLDRATQVLRGDSLDPGTVRSFAFSALLAPFLWLGEALGLPSIWTLGVIRTAMLAVGLATVAVVVRTGARLFGSRAGLIAGIVTAFNPVFLQYSGEPLTAILAAFCMALAFDYGTRDGLKSRHAAATGIWLGVGLMVAFKTIPIAGILLLGALFKGRLRGARYWLIAWGAYMAMALLQCLLDLLTYGAFGSSLLPYLAQNFAVVGNLFQLLAKLGVPYCHDIAYAIYNTINSGTATTAATNDPAAAAALAQSAMSRDWYLRYLDVAFMAPPVIAALALGMLAGLRKHKKGAMLLFLVVVIDVAMLSLKSSKSFRLWLPLLPFLALFAGLGFDTLWSALEGTKGRLTRTIIARVGLATCLMWLAFGSYSTLKETNLRKYGAWWQATEILDRHAAAAGETWTMASAYYWAVRFRNTENLSVKKLSHHMDRWAGLDDTAKREVLAEIDKLDCFVAHLQVLTQDPEIMRRVNERFEIVDILYRKRDFEELNALYVMKKRTPGREPERSFYEIYKDIDAGAYQATIQTPHSVDFRRPEPDGEVMQMVLLGWDFETGLAAGELGWMTFHWYVGPTKDHNYRPVIRLTDPDDRSLNRNTPLAFGAWQTSALETGWVIKESFPIPVPTDPREFGGANCRGDSLPAKLWMGVAEYALVDGVERQIGGLNPFHPTAVRPIAKRRSSSNYVSDDNYRVSADGLMQIGGVWIPVPDDAILPDDGRPLKKDS
jgi:hypothetical protein